jgi:hypothetical protein
MAKTRKTQAPDSVDLVGIEIGAIHETTPGDLATIASKGKYDKAIEAILELEPGQNRLLGFGSVKLAKLACQSIGTYNRRANAQAKPGRELVFRMKVIGKALKVLRIQ